VFTEDGLLLKAAGGGLEALEDLESHVCFGTGSVTAQDPPAHTTRFQMRPR
jgi:hypothetical protein